MQGELNCRLAVLDNAFKDLVLKHDSNYPTLKKEYPHRLKAMSWFFDEGEKSTEQITIQDVCDTWDLDIGAIRELAKVVYMTKEWHGLFEDNQDGSVILSDRCRNGDMWVCGVGEEDSE